MTDKFSKQIKQKMEGFEKPAPELSWSEIDSLLDKRAATSRPSTTHLWTKRIVAAAAVALIAISGGKFLFDKTIQETSHDEAVPLTTSVRLSSPTLQTTQTHKPIKTPQAVKTPQVIQAKHEDHIAIATKVETVENKQEETQLVDKPQEKETIARKNNSNSKNYDLFAQTANLTDNKKKKTRSQGFQADIHAQGLLAYADKANKGMTVMHNYAMSSAPVYDNGEPQIEGAVYPLFLQKATPDVEYNHDMPIRLGVNFRCNISPRWSITTGVNYSYLHSTYTVEGQAETLGDQKLHYIGIPLTANYTVWQSNHLSLYVSAGVTAEKLLKGKRSLSITGNDNDDNSVTEKRLQWSTQAAAGVEYNITPYVGLYLEPGVTHHFDNHSSVENIYKDKPWNFSLNFGFRINLK